MDLRIAVTPKGWDDIGSVMRRLEYAYKQISTFTLRNAEALDQFDAVFINCSWTSALNAQAAKHTLRMYVEKGGTIYASDYAADYLAAAFPEYIRFAQRQGKTSQTRADVVDRGLGGLLGDSLSLKFDMAAWQQISSISKGVRIYLRSWFGPLLVSFEHGKGHVIYTCFHNHTQISEKEAQLLRFLVLKPLMASAAAEVVDLAEWGKGQVQETVSTISDGEATSWYTYHFSPGGSLAIALNWKGRAKLRLELQGPSGHWQQEANIPPLLIRIPIAQVGEWSYRVIGLEVSHKNFPLVLVIGPSSQVTVPPPSSGVAPIFDWAPVATRPEVDARVLDSIRILDKKDEGDSPIEIRILDDDRMSGPSDS